MKIEIDETKKWQFSLTLKVVLLAILGLFLLIPLEMIKSIIRERQKSSENVIKEIALQWAGQQIIAGPVLNIPAIIPSEKNGKESEKIIIHLMPDSLSVNGDIQAEKRHISLYQTAVLTGKLHLSGCFNLKETGTFDKAALLWNDAYFSMGISDNRGLKGNVILDTDSGPKEAVPGLKDNEVFNTGITFPAELSGEKEKINFSSDLVINASQGMNFIPAGKNTYVFLQSKWRSPGFKGNFLPSERTINESGFSAKWLVTNLNRNFPLVWSGNTYNVLNDSFGVDFILPVDHYQKSERSAKYGILFIALTFLSLIFTELTGQKHIHIFHYILVSLALVLFFSLLNSLSEYTGFNLAYLISSVATAGLISMFLMRLLKSRRTAIFITGILIFLYLFIFILLTLNDYAYLAGNIGLFILLSVTMKLSLKSGLFSNSGPDGQN